MRINGLNNDDFNGEIEEAPKLKEIVTSDTTVAPSDKTTDLLYRPEQITEVKVEDIIACAIELAHLGHPLMLDKESLQKLNQAVNITVTPKWNKLLEEIRGTYKGEK